jgi:hypothetical protein
VPTPVDAPDSEAAAATDERTASEIPSPEADGAATSPPGRTRRFLRPRIGLIVALVGLCGLLTFETIFIAKGTGPHEVRVATTASPPALEMDGGISLSKVAVNPSLSTTEEQKSMPAPEFSEDGVDDEPRRARPKHFATVQEASIGSCTTSSVDGLSRQIIEQVRCSDPNAFVPIPARPNLVLEPQILPYLELSARDHLIKALDKNRDKTLTIHSALRTVAQQYLVWRWAANRRCGVQMATPPGESNHETGRALDIAEQAQWRSALEAQEFRWLGSSDAVHFDFKSSRALSRAPDILAFQRLWNRNHSDDRIAESGLYDAATELRLKKSPPGGFRQGATCAKARGTATSKAKGARR